MRILQEHVLNVVVHEVEQTVESSMVLAFPNSLNESYALSVVVCLGHDMPHEHVRVEMVQSAFQDLLGFDAGLFVDHLCEKLQA